VHSEWAIAAHPLFEVLTGFYVGGLVHWLMHWKVMSIVYRHKHLISFKIAPFWSNALMPAVLRLLGKHFLMQNTSMVSLDGGLQAKSMTSQRAEPSKMACMRYYGNVMTTTRWRLYVTMFYIFNSTVIDWTCYIFF